METPSSTRMVTRSQTKKLKEAERIGENGKEKRALVDITNDSPIVGLAKAQFLKSPFSEKAKKRVNFKITGSGESLLRCQVKTLLEKVEEKTEIPNLFGNHNLELEYVTPSLFGKKMGIEIFGEKKDFVTRSLIFDFMEKSDGYDSSEERKEKKMTDEDEELVNELCEGMSKMNIVKVGKHSRFVYDNDDELIEVQEEERIVASPAAMHLKGLPKFEGKHIRFDDEN